MSRILKEATNQVINKYNFFTHKGIDIVKYKNRSCEVIAHSSGRVVEVEKGKKNNKGSKGTESYGNYVKIEHDNGMYTLYAHLKNVKVNKNSYVNRGDIIGFMGMTGNAYGVHLHFEVRNKLDIKINPTKYIDNDLPKNEENINIYYQVYDNKYKKWLPNVVNDDDYAGNFKNSIGGIYINLTVGNIKYRVHEKNGKWLPTVFNRDDYAGNLGKEIDGVQIESDTSKILYRVHLKELGWLPYIDKWDNTNDGYAGIYGYDIDGIQIMIKRS